MFFAVPLPDSGLPSWINWVMTSFLLFHLLSHVVFTVNFYTISMYYKQKIFFFNESQMLNYKSDAIMRATGAERSAMFDDPVRFEYKIS